MGILIKIIIHLDDVQTNYYDKYSPNIGILLHIFFYDAMYAQA